MNSVIYIVRNSILYFLFIINPLNFQQGYFVNNQYNYVEKISFKNAIYTLMDMIFILILVIIFLCTIHILCRKHTENSNTNKNT